MLAKSRSAKWSTGKIPDTYRFFFSRRGVVFSQISLSQTKHRADMSRLPLFYFSRRGLDFGQMKHGAHFSKKDGLEYWLSASSVFAASRGEKHFLGFLGVASSSLLGVSFHGRRGGSNARMKRVPHFSKNGVLFQQSPFHRSATVYLRRNFDFRG